ncbi:hypothetical protein GDO86_020450 [Hymenochirus boettgeri]|uniref:Elongation factor 1-delta n=2 Tax=Hymenochirus TaxID=8361 RepID=A0A8T2II83_9PIPI|nr:hypothetical protein GDO86_020450 [Hymenochirus boettgeri]
MRTRKHQSPVESTWVDKQKYDEASKLNSESQMEISVRPPAGHRDHGVSNGVNLPGSADNSFNTDQKKVNGKKQKRRRKSPKRFLLPSFDCTLEGLMADCVWFDRSLYEEAECAYYTKCATDHARQLEVKPLGRASMSKSKKSGERGFGNHRHPPVGAGCGHGGMVACHHVTNGVWLNKHHFDEAEDEFVVKFQSPMETHSLGLSLRHLNCECPVATWQTPDEGYISALSTPAAQHFVHLVPPTATDSTVNGKPHWAGLQDVVAEVWLDKSAFDQAEKCFYETISTRQSSLKDNPPHPWSVQPGKKGKREKWNRKSNSKRPPAKKRELPVILEEPRGLLQNTVYYFLHQDSETVWLDKTSYDKAEAIYYAAQVRTVNSVRKMSASFLNEKIWLDKSKYDDAERQFYEHLSINSAPGNPHHTSQEDGASIILRDIARARENIQKSLAGSPAGAPTTNGDHNDLAARVATLEQESQNLHKVIRDLQSAISKLEKSIEKSTSTQPCVQKPIQVAAPVQKVHVTTAAAPPPKEENGTAEDDDDIDLFGSDEEEDAEAERIREERLRQYAEKKSKKPGVIAKSSILLDVKPWDDETDMAKLEECVRTIQMDGLLWGSSKLVPVGYGIKKLQIQCVVEDDKVGTDILEEEITKFEDYVSIVPYPACSVLCGNVGVALPALHGV